MIPIQSEWTKLSTLRATRVQLGIAVVLSPVLSALAALIVGLTHHDWKPQDVAGFEPIGFSMIGTLVGGIVFAVLGVRAVTAEYGSGMIRLSLTATPRRERLLAAKAAVVALVTLVAGTVMTVAMFVAAQAILSGYDVESAGLGDGDALRAVLATSVTSPIVPLFALSLGFMLRSTAGAITSVLGLIFVPAIVGAILPQSWQDHVLVYLPGAASDAIAFGQLPDAPHGLSPAIAALVLAGWTALFLGGALLALERRDA
jgi:ABC-type transport system involved in multi-copper enzyme maturation permease subunit